MKEREYEVFSGRENLVLQSQSPEKEKRVFLWNLNDRKKNLKKKFSSCPC